MGDAPRLINFESIVLRTRETDAQFAALVRNDIHVHPIPFFGNPQTASVATFGVNPSAIEFKRNSWPLTLPMAGLEQRCVEYFRDPGCLPHPWFRGYDDALRMLNHSYDTDTIHLDLSPRPTRSMRTLDPAAFVEMMLHDRSCFVQRLGLCSNLKAAVMSGCVTGKYYMDEFLKKHLPTPFSLTLRRRYSERKRGATAVYSLSGPDLHIPVLFVSTSPSGDAGVRLKSEVARLREQLVLEGF